MKYVYRLLATLIVLAAVGLAGFAYLGDLSPIQSQTEQPVTLNVD
ncbi:hypothetical protein [Solirhodobacter olei]|jgi:hypothetical protein|nr:hypothetical protein [Solirhodobacter olei]